MPSFYATTDSIHTGRQEQNARLVLFVVYPDIVLLDLVGPLQVFSHALVRAGGANGYRCAVSSMTGGMTTTNTVVQIPTEPLLSFLDQEVHTLIIVGGDGANQAMHDVNLINLIKQLEPGLHRICSVCSGALVLAATGLLDGRRAVTHWDDCKTLQDAFPSIRVELDPIFINDGNVWTSAGITAGIDMALAIVEEDLGRRSALAMARSIVTQMVRSGGQSQFSPVLERQLQDAEGGFEALHRWISENLTSDLRVDTLASQSNMSPRNFSRIYRKHTGMTPAKAVEMIRIEAARSLLESTKLPVKTIAAQSGFHDEERMRRAFVRAMNVTPSDYRNSFNPD